MQNINPVLFVEINELNYIFVAGIYDKNDNLKVVGKIITLNNGIDKNKFTNIDDASYTIKKNVELIENKLNYIFKDLTVIVDNFRCTCLNISGYKKLNGSQVLKENISYILNSLKSSITENEKKKTILHIFNSKSILDGKDLTNLPIGLFGDFYNHMLTFILIENNDLKNINQIFNKCNLKVKKIILKNFVEGTQLINQNQIETFFKIKIGKESSNVSFFEKSSYIYEENFNFGTNIILKDISKICSLENETIKNILSDNLYQNININNNEFLEEKYFLDRSYRKIRKKLIFEIAKARIEEIIDIILKRNINSKSFRKDEIKTYINIQDEIIYNNFKSYFLKSLSSEPILMKSFDLDSLIDNVAKLSIYGWRKEAIPVIQTKKSLITRIFQSVFG